MIAAQESALQLRYLQTLAEIAVEKNSTIVFPLPIDLITPFISAASRSGTNGLAVARTADAVFPVG